VHNGRAVFVWDGFFVETYNRFQKEEARCALIVHHLSDLSRRDPGRSLSTACCSGKNEPPSLAAIESSRSDSFRSMYAHNGTGFVATTCKQQRQVSRWLNKFYSFPLHAPLFEPGNTRKCRQMGIGVVLTGTIWLDQSGYDLQFCDPKRALVQTSQPCLGKSTTGMDRSAHGYCRTTKRSSGLDHRVGQRYPKMNSVEEVRLLH